MNNETQLWEQRIEEEEETKAFSNRFSIRIQWYFIDSYKKEKKDQNI